MNTVKKIREEKTKLYWEICQAYNRQIGPRKGLTTGKALNLLADIEQTTPFKGVLRKKTTTLLDEIIHEPGNAPRYFNNVIRAYGGDDAA